MPSVEALNELLRGIAVLPDAHRAERSEEERLSPPRPPAACNPMSSGLQPYVLRPATLWNPACDSRSVCTTTPPPSRASKSIWHTCRCVVSSRQRLHIACVVSGRQH